VKAAPTVGRDAWSLVSSVTVVRALLVVVGLAAIGYGGILLRPQLADTLVWLLAGPLLHDAVVAPLVGLIGLGLARLVPARRWRALLATGLVVSAVLLLIAVPLRLYGSLS
jgi:hypothetical protein